MIGWSKTLKAVKHKILQPSSVKYKSIPALDLSERGKTNIPRRSSVR